MDKFVLYKNKPKSVHPTKETIVEREGAVVELYTDFLDKEKANLLFKELSSLPDWKIENTMTKGGLKQTSRLVIVMAEPLSDPSEKEKYNHVIGKGEFPFSNADYNMDMIRDIKPFSPILNEAKTKIENLIGEKFNYAYLNFYRDGQDHIGWHADKEEKPGDTIASLSLGATRDFLLRHIKETKTAQEIDDPALKRECMDRAKITMPLKSGALLLMKGLTQNVYHHHVPVRTGVTEPRINITFRIR